MFRLTHGIEVLFLLHKDKLQCKPKIKICIAITSTTSDRRKNDPFN